MKKVIILFSVIGILFFGTISLTAFNKTNHQQNNYTINKVEMINNSSMYNETISRDLKIDDNEDASFLDEETTDKEWTKVDTAISVIAVSIVVIILFLISLISYRMRKHYSYMDREFRRIRNKRK